MLVFLFFVEAKLNCVFVEVRLIDCDLFYFRVLYDNMCMVTATAIVINIMRSRILSVTNIAQYNSVIQSIETDRNLIFNGMALCFMKLVI